MIMKISRPIFALLLALALVLAAWPGLAALAAAGGPAAPGGAFEEAFVAGEVLAPAASEQEARHIAAAYGLTLKSYAYGIAVLAAPDAQVAVAESLAMAATPLPRGATPLPCLSLNWRYYISEESSPYKPAYSYGDTKLYGAPESFRQWHHDVMDSASAWKISSGANVLVAVIDTGIDIDHPDFAGRISALSYNSHTMQGGLASVRDDYGHGTHVSGILAGAYNDSAGVCGVAPDAEILMIKGNHPDIPNMFETAS
jgi:subtilisin family serine protease